MHASFTIGGRNFDNANSWKISVSIRVLSSTVNTYFMMAGFQPGGYSGIQQTGRGRHAIFSLWDGSGNDKAKNVWYNKKKGGDHP